MAMGDDGARVAVGRRRAGDAEFDGDVARPGPVEDAQRQHRVDPARPLRQEGRVLLLGEADAAQRRPQADADPVPVFRPQVQPGIGDGHLGGGDGELRKLVQPLQLFAVEIGRRDRSR